MLNPPRLLDMVQINKATRIRIPMRRRQYTPPPQLQRLLLAQIIMVLRIQHAIRECLPGTHAEQVPCQPRAVAVNVVQCRSFLGRHTGAHGAHAETHALVGVDEVGEDLGGGGDGDAAFVAEFVEAALHA